MRHNPTISHRPKDSPRRATVRSQTLGRADRGPGGVCFLPRADAMHSVAKAWPLTATCARRRHIQLKYARAFPLQRGQQGYAIVTIGQPRSFSRCRTDESVEVPTVRSEEDWRADQPSPSEQADCVPNVLGATAPPPARTRIQTVEARRQRIRLALHRAAGSPHDAVEPLPQCQFPSMPNLRREHTDQRQGVQALRSDYY